MATIHLDRKYAPEFQRMLEYAAYDCAQRGAREVVPDHLLLALYREDFPLIDEVLSSFQVDSMVVLDRLLRAYPEAEKPSRPETVAMSPESLQVIALAEQESARVGLPFVTPATTFLAVIEHGREHLERYFIREKVYRKREDEVIDQVRDLVRWLRCQPDAGSIDRETTHLDEDTLLTLESVRLNTPDPRELKAFAVRLRMLKRFRSARG